MNAASAGIGYLAFALGFNSLDLLIGDLIDSLNTSAALFLIWGLIDTVFSMLAIIVANTFIELAVVHYLYKVPLSKRNAAVLVTSPRFVVQSE